MTDAYPRAMTAAYIWPDVFNSPDFEYDLTNEHVVLEAIMDGLTGWGLICAQVDPPRGFKAFSKTMAKISKVTGCISKESLIRKVAKLCS